MAKVIITLADNGDGSIYMKAEFDPPVDESSGDGTPAQQLAAGLLDEVLSNSQNEDFDNGSN